MFAYPELLEDYKEKHGAARMWIIDTNGTYQDTGGMNKNFADKKEHIHRSAAGERGNYGCISGRIRKTSDNVSNTDL